MARKKEPDIATIDKSKMPRHIAFIMDGNGRWAKKRGLPRKFGHAEGAKTFRKILRYCKSIGIEYVSFYAFSTENWKRPQDEVDAIMNLFRDYLKDLENFLAEECRAIFIGDKSIFDEDIRLSMEDFERRTAHCDKMTMLLAVNYGGRDEIVNAAKSIATKVKNGEMSVSDIDEAAVNAQLYTACAPDVDLMIRPSGEQRISNFLLWQSAYAEFYYTDVLWPDFSPKHLDAAIEDFSNRKRRFGGV